MTNTEPLRGVYCPLLTPMTDTLAPDIERLIGHARRVIDDGCHGVAPFGSTGEANSFSVDERMLCLESLTAAGLPPERMLPGTGMCALSDSVRLTEHAVRLGCAGVLMLPPFYYKGVDDDGLFANFAEVIERVGDSRLRVYLYHIPPVSQVGFPLPLIERLVAAYPDTVVGLKDSGGDWSYTKALLDALPGFGAFSGNEAFLLQNRRAGGAGTITATANINSSAIRDLFDNWQADDADARQEAVTRRRNIVQGYPLVPALKRVNAARTGDDTWRNMRPPMTPLGDEGATTLIDALIADGFAALAEAPAPAAAAS